jgi:hypothetical protein
MKKNRRDEPVGVIVHINMEIAQEISLCSYLYPKQAKLSLFFLCSSSKLEDRRAEHVLPGGE